MSNTAETYWAVDGQSIQTMAFNIVTLGGSRAGVPPLRGNNTQVPYMVGQADGPRIPDSRVITLAMWVIGVDEDGDIPSGTLRAQYDANWNKLRRLFWQPKRQFALQKRLRNENGDLIAATAQARFAGGLEPEMAGPFRGAFTVDLLLADPFFYADAVVTEAFTTNQTKSLTVLGDYETTKIDLTLAANARLTNTTYTPDVWAELTAAGTIDVYDGTVDTGGSGIMRHSGSSAYFLLNPGVNSVTLAGSSASISYQPAYF